MAIARRAIAAATGFTIARIGRADSVGPAVSDSKLHYDALTVSAEKSTRICIEGEPDQGIGLTYRSRDFTGDLVVGPSAGGGWLYKKLRLEGASEPLEELSSYYSVLWRVYRRHFLQFGFDPEIDHVYADYNTALSSHNIVHFNDYTFVTSGWPYPSK